MEKEKKKINSYNKDNIRWLIMLLCIIIFLIITYTLFQNQIEQFDNRIYKMLASYISEPLTSIFKIITNFGGAICICTITAGILILVKNKKYGIYTFINLLIIAFINQTLKYIIQRPRPTVNPIIIQDGYSFPSGHSMVSMAFYGFIIYLIYKKIQNRNLKWGLCIALSILIILIGISRIYLGVHYASDVIGGFCFSIGYLSLYTKIIKID